ncbi:AbrB/MazE/SpoVT family DNA-binding domain-containing protein [Candidatus Thioglobus sp.]|jgi:antitoxin MazE|uniref:AbrB/MazE/SpoVT family DNA-binding domain-containing protein n=1 Tax=Candidatus Pseudothioglobus sp. Uisw_041 TaxID=3230996 RepID=UPI0023103171|nr:AbrB/MazE/SpoVT family DNA-binding domain-containing protein [Candidatus Thioglobus sp.]MDC1447093.1 AbrB/MazE/SpoVT family DNA-binding domain-containing protein [Candidatus Thioglobus sp.]
MAKIIKIGNSQGIRIPKPIIALANLENIELDFVVLDSGLLITPDKKARVGWKNNSNQDQLTATWEWRKNQ